MRKPHRLSRVRSNEYPHVAVWFDTETDQIPISDREVKHVLRFGWAAYRRRLKGDKWSAPQWFRYTTIAEFWDWVESLRGGRNCIHMFAHNCSFDLPVLDAFNELPRRDYRLWKAVIDSPPVILSWRKSPTTIKIIDTLNIWRMPLAAIGEKLGMPKLDMPDKDASTEEWDTYGKRDVEIIMAACLDWWSFLREHDLGGFAPTLAAQSLRAYCHRFMRHRIYIDANTKGLDLARDAYHGGRVECFRLGEINGPLHKLDINSMYPAVMRDNLYPIKIAGVYKDVSHSELTRWLNKYCVVARCKISTNEPVYSVLTPDKLLFPVGEFSTTLCTPELQHAMANGHIIAIERAAVYDGAPIFSSFVDEMYRLRMLARSRGDKTDDWRLKILANSLYGKFGQRGRVYETEQQIDSDAIKVWVELDAETGEVHNMRQFARQIQRLVGTTESRESHPAIAAHVTAYARMLLWQLICVAGRENVFYVDTDSLLTSPSGLASLVPWIDSDRLGYLKEEGVYESVTLYGPKDYVMGREWKSKGISKKALCLLDGRYEQEQWSSLVGLVRRGDLTAPTTRLVKKTLHRRYTKGIVVPGGAVMPLRLPT